MLKITWLRRLLWVAVALIAVWVLAWLAVPPLLKSQVEQQGSKALGRTLTLGAVQFNPLTLELTLSDLKIASADGKTTQLSVARLYADAEMQSLFRLAPVIDAVTIDQPRLALTHLGDGHYDIDDILQHLQSAPSEPASAPARFAVYNVVLNDGAADFVDHIGGVERSHSLRKLNISLPFLSSFDSQRDVTVQPHLAFELNGSVFDTAAQATPFAQVRKGDLSLQVAHLDIAPYLPYVPAGLPVRIKSAVLDSSLKLSFAQATVNQLQISGAFKVSDIRVDDRTGAPLLQAASLQAVLKELRPLEQRLDLESLTLVSPSITLARKPGQDWLQSLSAEPAPVRAKALPGPNAKQGSKAMDQAKAGAQPNTSVAATAAASAPAAPVAASAPVAVASAPGGWKVAVQQILVKDGKVRVDDASVSPPAKLLLSDTEVKLSQLSWPFDKAAQLALSARLQAQDAGSSKPASLAISGEGSDALGSATLRISDLGLPLAAPYLSAYLVPKVGGVLEGELSASWKGDALQLGAKRLAVHDFALSPPPGNSEITVKELPSFKLLEVGDVNADLQKHALSVGKLALSGPKARLARGDDGKWMFARWLPPAQAVPADAPAPAAKASAAAAGAARGIPPWTASVGDVALDDGTLTLVDRLPAKPVFLELSALQAHTQKLALDGKKPVPLTLSAKVRSVRTDPGSLRFDGSLAWDPLLAQGALEVKQFPAQALAPYFLHKLHLDLLRADTSFKGQLRYAGLPAGPDVQLRGDAALEDLKLNSALKSASGADESEELLSWKALSVPGIEFIMSPAKPLRLTLREVSLSDFFARLIVNPAGRLVLQELVGGEPADKTDSGAAAPASAPAASAPPPAQVASANDPVIDVGTIRLVNGHVAFSDRFIKPNYSADLTELAGSLSHFSSQQPQGSVQMADLELRGRAEGTASLEITGKLNPLAKPLALDINAKVRDLELSPLSSYAIKYAGYGIERGKLSVDLHYAVSPDGQLRAANNIVLNQLVFGDAAAGATTSLPVKLAVALLADSNGVIDLNVPVSGSLNDPQFRVWPIVWKVVGNIIAKALTSPFSLISGLLGGAESADDLSNVAFAPGSAVISAAGVQGLDQVAKALVDKPVLRLTIEGTASLEREADAIKMARLQEMLLAEKRRAAASAGKDVTAVAALTPEESPTLLKEVYRRSSIKKPRNLVGLAKDLSPDEMQTLLLASIPVDEDSARDLALARSLAVREYLTAHQVPTDRLFLGAVKTTPSDASWQPRAELNIEHH